VSSHLKCSRANSLQVYFAYHFQDFDRSPKDTFFLSDGTEISFIDYFKKKYNICIKDPNQPLIVNRPKAKTAHEETTARLIVLVPEQCYLTGLTDVSRIEGL
jgi:aubergine-like protein